MSSSQGCDRRRPRRHYPPRCAVEKARVPTWRRLPKPETPTSHAAGARARETPSRKCRC